MASHSTLEQLHIEARGQQLDGAEWIGAEVQFPMGENERQLERWDAGMMFQGHIEEESVRSILHMSTPR